MKARMPDGRCFEMSRELIDVTCLSRPDTSWRFMDSHGHEHRWYVGQEPAREYRPQESYTTPSLIYVVDDRWIDEDGEEQVVGHHECGK